MASSLNAGRQNGAPYLPGTTSQRVKAGNISCHNGEVCARSVLPVWAAIYLIYPLYPPRATRSLTRLTRSPVLKRGRLRRFHLPMDQRLDVWSQVCPFRKFGQTQLRETLDIRISRMLWEFRRRHDNVVSQAGALIVQNTIAVLDIVRTIQAISLRFSQGP